MEGRDPDRGSAEHEGVYDDWFDEPEAPPARRRRGGRRGADAAPDDPWEIPDAGARRARRSEAKPLVIAGRVVTPTQAAILAGSGIVVLLAILAAAGVFSGSSTPSAVTVTTVKQPASTTPATTTPTTPSTPTVQAPSTTLKPGDTGAQVKRLQQTLKALGHSPGTIDGSYGPGTKTAVAAFQTAQGLTADGVVGSQTLAALKQALTGQSGTPSTFAQPPTTTLKPGDTGAQVTLLQQALAALGHSPGKADGSYGPSTKQAVMAFQTAQGLTADGIVGSKTLAALTSALAASG
jgi:peptidoglycan hydrolase-like protein with peptidoglycan-binding domain